MKNKFVNLPLILLVAVIFGGAAFNLSGCNSAGQAPQQQVLTQLSADDVSLILKENVPPQQLQMFKDNPQQLEPILKELKDLLVTAAEARRTGFTKEPAVAAQLEFISAQSLANLYETEQTKGATTPVAPFSGIKAEEVEAFGKEAGNEAKFTELLELTKKQAADAGQPIPEPTEDQVKKFREQYARIMLTARKARTEKFDQKRDVQLQTGIQQASFIALEFGKRQEDQFTVSDAELAEYIAQNPKYDVSKKRAQAEDLLRRAKAGEDFAALAKEFSEDPGSKDKGGLYENISKGQFVPEFEKAAFAMQKGQISDLVETKFGYHIIKLENKGTKKDKDGKPEETFSARHILINTTAQNSENPLAPQSLSLTDGAKEEIKKVKRDKWVEEISARNTITIPAAADIRIEAPVLPPMMPQMPGGMEMPPDMPPAQNMPPQQPAPKPNNNK